MLCTKLYAAKLVNTESFHKDVFCIKKKFHFPKKYDIKEDTCEKMCYVTKFKFLENNIESFLLQFFYLFSSS